MNPMTKMCGLWKKTDKNGNDMFTGKISEYVSVLIFKNKFKNKDSDPEYIMHFTNPAKKEPSVAPIANTNLEDDVPF